MSDDKDIDKEFRAVVDAFIHLANKQSETVAPENVSMALLYAAARFNSFVVAAHADDIKKYQTDREAATVFFLGEYKKMLAENLDDYQKVYDQKYAHLVKRDT